MIKGSRTDWAILNSSIEELARSYGAEVSACSPYSPKEKPRVEGNVNAAYTKIYAPLRNCTFYSLEDINIAFRDGENCTYVKLSHFLNPTLGERRENAICSDLSLMREVKLLIIDHRLNAEVNEKSVLMIKEVLDYRTNNVGTILVSHCDPKGWRDRLLGTKAMVTSLMENIGKPLEIRLKDISAGTKEEA